MNAVIRTEELAKRFGRVTALEGVSLEIPPGVVWALLGRNGDGKSTLVSRRFADVHVDVACLRLALRAYQLEHGRYPDRLEELVPKYMPEIPQVPGSTTSFGLRYPRATSPEDAARMALTLTAGIAEFPLEPPPGEDEEATGE